MEAQMSYEHRETKGTRFGFVYIENLGFNRERVLRREERPLKKRKMKRGRRSHGLIAINGRLVNRRLRLTTVRSRTEGNDLIFLLMKKSIESSCPSDLHRAALI